MKAAGNARANLIPLIDRTKGGAVYPLSVLEGIQQGEAFAREGSLLIRHRCGFAFAFGACDQPFLDRVYEEHLKPGCPDEKRFVLFAEEEAVRRYFHGKSNLVPGKRYFFTWPEAAAPETVRLPSGFRLRPIDAELFNRLRGRVEPRAFWSDGAAFLQRGMGVCVMDGETAAAWAFSAGVSSEEVDIGIETAAEYRRTGLGRIAAGEMIRACLRRGLRPVWACGAGNEASERMAEKLGFVRTAECDTFRKE